MQKKAWLPHGMQMVGCVHECKHMYIYIWCGEWMDGQPPTFGPLGMLRRSTARGWVHGNVFIDPIQRASGRTLKASALYICTLPPPFFFAHLAEARRLQKCFCCSCVVCLCLLSSGCLASKRQEGQISRSFGVNG